MARVRSPRAAISPCPKWLHRVWRLLGCSVGMVNVPRIKGNHNAMLSGKAAAERAYEAIQAGRAGDELTAYEDDVRNGEIGQDLKKVRNVKPLWSKYGLMTSLAVGGFDMWTNTFGFSLWGRWGMGNLMPRRPKRPPSTKRSITPSPMAS